jgi:hypothetical protein
VEGTEKSVSNMPHPFSDWKSLQRQVLGKFEGKITDIKDRPQPDRWDEMLFGILQKERRNQLYLK